MSDFNVEQIAKLAREGMDTVQERAATQFPTVVIPTDFKVESLERFFDTKNMFTGRFVTTRISDYIKYFDTYNSVDNAMVFVSPDAFTASTAFDLGDIGSPGHSLHTALLGLDKTSSYKGMLEVLDRLMSQDELFNFMQDWRMYITAVDENGSELDFLKTCLAVRNIDIKEVSSSEYGADDFTNEKSSSAKIEAKAKGDMKLPAGLVFTCNPYADLESRNFFLRLGIGLKRHDEAPKLKLRCEGLEGIQEEMATEFSELLSSSFGDKAEILIGTFQV